MFWRDRTGSIIFSAQGGTPPLYYSVDSINFMTNSVEIGLGGGTYSCYVKDKNGCLTSAGVATVNEPPPFSVTLGQDITIKLETGHAIKRSNHQWSWLDKL